MVKPWKEYRREISRLYIREGLTLTEVRTIMRERYDFQASCVFFSHADILFVFSFVLSFFPLRVMEAYLTSFRPQDPVLSTAL